MLRREEYVLCFHDYQSDYFSGAGLFPVVDSLFVLMVGSVRLVKG